MADVTIRTVGGTTYSVGFRPLFWTSATVGYFIFINTTEDLVYKKTTNGGATWGSDVTIRLDTSLRKFSCWADWHTSGDTGTKLHIVWVGSGSVAYRSLDTSDDTLSTEVNVKSVSGTDTGTSYRDGAIIDIVKARGGNLYCAFYNEDAVTDTSGFERSTDGGVTWDAKAEPWEGEAERIILQPGDAADSNDIMAFFWDQSAEEIDRKLYDDSADSWSTTNIATGVTDSFTDTHMWSACHRHSDNHSILIVQTGGDVSTVDMQCWDIASGSITAKTDVWTNEDDHAGAAIAINQNNDDLYAVFCGDPCEVLASALNVYRSKSTDGGTTWDTKVQINEACADNYQEVFVDTSVGDTLAGLIGVAWVNVDACGTDDDILFSAVNSISIDGGEKVFGGPTNTYKLMAAGII